MNPNLTHLQPYPFQRLRALLSGCTPAAEKRHINLSIGEPKHPTPDLIKQALTNNLNGLASYPLTVGNDTLRNACTSWLQRRYDIEINPKTEVLPVNGSREALFSLVQTVIDPTASATEKPIVISPNPFYQIYEGAAILAGAEPFFVNCTPETSFQPDWSVVTEAIWRRTQLVFVCSPGNPTGAVMSLDDWATLFALSDKYGFVIASDECYSEIYSDRAPLSGLEAAKKLGRNFERLVIFTSLSKRSNVPGMRSGFVAGDASILEKFLLYRTYHGGAMCPTIQEASIAAWNDEGHVVANRQAYTAKFDAVTSKLASVLEVSRPDASFYLWAKVAGDDAEFTKALFEAEHITVLPGSYLARTAHGVNPGQGYIRIALVAPLAECVEAIERIQHFVTERKTAA